MKGGLRASALVGWPVCLRDIRLGMVADVLFDGALRRALGLDVRCGDRAHRFLPFAAAELRDGRVVVDSALVLLSAGLEFYRAHGHALSTLRGISVTPGAVVLGTLDDLVLDPTGAITAFVLLDGEERELPAGSGFTLGPNSLRPAV
jgi:PRC-barrel domain protein